MNFKSTKIVWTVLAIVGILAGAQLVSQKQILNKDASSQTSIVFNPVNQDLNKGNPFSTQVSITTEQNNVTGMDIEIIFDPLVISIQKIEPTSDLVNFTNIIKNEIDNSNGRIRYATFTIDKSKAISGSINILKITGTILNTASKGLHVLEFSPKTSLIATGESQNILVNKISGNINVLAGTGDTQGEPNSCGGTCGSNDNCQSNFFCFEGYCRKPECPTDTNCDCVVPSTPSPTNKISIVTQPYVEPVEPVEPIETYQEPAFITDPTIYPDNTFEPIFTDAPTEINIESEGMSSATKILIALGTLGLIGIAILFSWKKKNNNIPHILPPTNI